MGVNRRALWLGAILVVALIGVMVGRSTDVAAPAAASGRKPAPSGAAAAKAGAPAAAMPLELNLAVLQRERGKPRDLGRNPFRFRPPPASARPPAGRPLGQPAEPGAPVVPAGPPPPVPITLKFIGIVQKADGTRIAVLTDGKRPVSGTEGEEIEGRYRILKIGLESIELAYIDGSGRQTIRLNGQ